MSSHDATRDSVGRMVRRTIPSSFLVASLAMLNFALTRAAMADDTTNYYNYNASGVTTDWMDPNNWTDLNLMTTGVVPGPGSAVDVINAMPVTIGAPSVIDPNPTINIESLYVGTDGDQHGSPQINNPAAGDGTVNQNAGTLNINGANAWVKLGGFRNSDNSVATGTYNLSGTATLTLTNDWFSVGEHGNGVLTMSGTSHLSTPNFTVARWGDRTGTATMNGDSVLDVSGEMDIGTQGNGKFILNSGTVNAHNLKIANNNGSIGELDIHGGTFNNPSGDADIGTNGGGHAVVNQDGGTMNLETAGGNWTAIGRDGGTGVYNLTGGSVVSQHWLLVGRGNPASSGTFNISGTGALTTRSLWIAQDHSTGVVNQTGGTVNVGNQYFDGTSDTNFRVGFDDGNGTYNMSGGVLNDVSGAFVVTNKSQAQNMEIGDDRSKGVFNQTGGTVNENWIYNGNGGGPVESGTYNISAGTLNAVRIMAGTGGTGTYVQTGGVVNVDNDASIGDSGGVGVYTISGGTLTTGLTGTAATNSGGLQIGWNHGTTGTINQNGGTVVVGQSGVQFGGRGAPGGDAADPHGGQGTYNLSGGVLLTAGIYKFDASDTAAGTFNFNGGTLRATASDGTQTIGGGVGTLANFMTGLTAVNVQAGGAIVDVNSNTISFNNSLLHSGVGTDGGLTLSDSSVGGGGTLTLLFSNTFNGPTKVIANATAGPTLFVGNTGALQNSTVNISFSNSVQFTSGLGSATFGALSGSGNLPLVDTGAAAVSLTVGGNNSTTTYSGVMSGSGGLTKAGTGTLNLANPQTFTGTTAVNGGGLNLPLGVSLASPTVTVGGASATPGSNPTISGNGTVSGALIVNGAGGTGAVGHVAPGANTAGTNFGAAGTLNVGPLTLNGGSILDFDFGAPGPGNSDLIASTGALTLPAAGTGSVTVNLNNLGGFAVGTYKLITETSTTNFTTTVFSTGTDISGFQYAFTNPGGTEIDLVVTAAPTWSATAADSNWANPANWVSGIIPGSTSGTTNTDTATFDRNSTVLTPAPDLGRNLQSIKFNALAGAYVIGTTGGNALLLTTGGKIQMTSSVANTETVNAPLVLEGASGTYTFSNDSADNTKLLIIGGGVSGGAAGNTVLTLAGANTGANAVNGVISNGSATTLGLAKTGGGVWVLGGNNTFTGGVSLNAGTLRVGNAGALNSTSPNSVSFDGASTGVLALNGNSITISGLNSTSATAQVNNSNATAATLTVNSASPSLFAGILADGAGGGVLNLVVSGGSLTLSGNNTASGITDVTGAATLALGSLNALQNSTLHMTVANSVQFNPGVGTFTLGGLSGSANLTLQDTATNPVTVNIGNNNTNTTYSGVLSGPGGLTKVGTGTFTMTNANTYTGTIRVSGGTLQLGDGTTNNGSVASASIVNNATLAFANPNAQTYSGIISGTGAVTKSGAGTLTLTGGSTYSGGTTISAGTVNVGPAPLSNSSGPLGVGSVTLTGTNPTLSLQGVANVGLAAQFYNSAPANVGNQDPAYSALSTMNAKLDALTPAVTVSTVAGGKTDLNFTSGGTLGAGGFTGGGTRDYIFNKVGPTTALYGFPPVNVGTTGEDNFQVRMSGFIKITTEDDYTFTTTSDDGSVLFIDGADAPVVSNNLYQGMTLQSGTVHLTAGLHPISIGYYEGGGGLGLGVTYQDADGLGDTGGVMVAIPNSVLSLVNGGQFGTQSFLNNVVVSANSTINVANALTASLGGLSIGAVTLNVTSNDASAAPYSLTFNGNTTLTGNATINIANNTPTGVGRVNISNVGGAFSLTKTGAGVLSIGGTGTYSGGTVVSGGTVIANGPGTLGTGAVTLNNATKLQVVAISNPTPTIVGFNNGTGWTINSAGGGANEAPFTVGPNTLTLTTSNNDEGRTAFLNNRVNIANGFTVNYTYTMTGGGGNPADGMSVILQNDPAGATALGGRGGALAYSGITSSVAYEMNIYNGNALGTFFGVNGTTGGQNYQSTGAVNYRGDGTTGDPTNVSLSYDPVSQTIREVLTDTVTNATFTRLTATGDLTSLVGDTSAYFGFGGATGGLNATQRISNFSFALGTDSIYTNSVILTGGATSTVDISSTGPANVSMGPLTVGVGAGTTLNATFNGGANTPPSDTPYSLTFGTPAAAGGTLSGSFTVKVANNGTAHGTVGLAGATTFAPGISIQVAQGTLRFNNASGPATVGAGVTVNVASAASMELAGTVSDLSGNGVNPATPANRVHIVNSSTQAVGGGLKVTGTNQQVGAIDGTGDTVVSAGASLTANHIIQSALIIGGDALNPATVTIAASDPSGNPLAGGLAIAGSSAPMGAGGSSLLAGTAGSTGGSSLGGHGVVSLGGGTAAVPEPSSVVLFGLGGLAGLLAVMRRRRNLELGSKGDFDDN